MIEFIDRLPPAIRTLLDASQVLKWGLLHAAGKPINTTEFLDAWNAEARRQISDPSNRARLYLATMTRTAAELEMVLSAMRQLWLEILTTRLDDLPPPISAEVKSMAAHDPQREIEVAAPFAAQRVLLIRSSVAVPIVTRDEAMPWSDRTFPDSHPEKEALLTELGSLQIVDPSLWDDESLRDRLIWMSADMHANRKVRFPPSYLHQDGSVKQHPTDSSAEPFFYDIKGVGMTGTGTFFREQDPVVSPGHAHIHEALASWRNARSADSHGIHGSRFVALVMMPYHAPAPAAEKKYDQFWRPVVKLIELHVGRRSDYRLSHFSEAPLDSVQSLDSYLRAATKDLGQQRGYEMSSDSRENLMKNMVIELGIDLGQSLHVGYYPQITFHNLTPDAQRVDHGDATLGDPRGEQSSTGMATISTLKDHVTALYEHLAHVNFLPEPLSSSELAQLVDEGLRRSTQPQALPLFDQLIQKN